MSITILLAKSLLLKKKLRLNPTFLVILSGSCNACKGFHISIGSGLEILLTFILSLVLLL